jgi:hypothetical protein
LKQGGATLFVERKSVAEQRHVAQPAVRSAVSGQSHISRNATFGHRFGGIDVGSNLGMYGPPPVPEQITGGRPMAGRTRGHMERGFGHDFGAVRVHEDVVGAPPPQALGAAAYTIGRDIFVGRSLAEDTSPEDRGLLAHELAHVVQQRYAPSIQGKAFASDGSAAEAEADRAGATVLAGGHAQVSVRAETTAGGGSPMPQAGVFSALMCSYYLWKYSDLLDQCRNEYNQHCEDLTSDECLGWMDGAGYPSDAIMQCAGRKNPDALRSMLKWCAKTATGSYGRSKYTSVDPSDSGASLPGLVAGNQDPQPAEPPDPSVLEQDDPESSGTAAA